MEIQLLTAFVERVICLEDEYENQNSSRCYIFKVHVLRLPVSTSKMAPGMHYMYIS